MSGPAHEVLALRYAHLDRSSSQNFVGGDLHERPMPLDYAVWVIRGEAGTIVVDTGFDHEQAEARGRRLLTPVEDALHRVGVDHHAVDNVVITHLHYDHAGNEGLFPRARFHLQEREMRYATGPAMAHRACAAAFHPGDVAAMVHRVFDGRVRFHDGDAELAPGVTLHLVGGHTMGLQVVRVATARGPVLLASDACHFSANYLQRRPYPELYNVAELMAAYERFGELVPSTDHVVPGHDPEVFARYPAADATDDGVVRLDLEPRQPDRPAPAGVPAGGAR